MKYTTIEQLDAGLRLIYKNEMLEYYTIYSSKALIAILFDADNIIDSLPPINTPLYENGYPEIENSIVLIEVLNKLAKDGYLERFEKSETYSPNLDGRHFIENGGYAEQRKLKTAENIRLDKLDTAQKSYQSNTVALTAVLAIGTTIAAVYYILEIRQHHIGFYRWAYPIVLCAPFAALGTAVLWLFLKELRDKNQ